MSGQRSSAGPLLAVAGAAPIALILSEGSLAPVVSVALVVAGCAACLGLVRAERMRKGPSVRAVGAVIGLVLVIAVATPPEDSQDLWSYVMYGRMIAVHQASPWEHVPADFPHDPFVRRVARGWRHTPSVYGPVFTTYAAAGAELAGDSAVRSRLFFQLSAAAALLGALVLLWRHTRSPAAVALLGLHPAIADYTVNGGHNDLTVGMLLLVAVLLVRRRRVIAAGLVVGAAILVKVTAGLALGGLLLWFLRRRDWRDALHFGAPAVLITGVGYVLAGGAAISVLGLNSGVISRASPWQLAGRELGLEAGGGVLGLHRADALGLFTATASLAVLALAGVLAWRAGRSADPAPSAAVATATYPFGAMYALPWYSAWALPTLLLHPRARLTALAAVQGAFLAAAYEIPHGLPRVAFLPGDRPLVEYWIPLALLAAFVWTVLRDGAGRLRRATDRPTTV